MQHPKPDSHEIQEMFDHLAGRYDFFNRLTSMGLDTLWRQQALKVAKPGMRVLDIGCGTGDLSLLAARIVGPTGEVTGLDFSRPMLDIAKKRAQKLIGLQKAPRFVLNKAEELPVEKTLFDLAVSGFVLRNIYENIDRILDGIWASLRPGGQISFLDLTEPPGPIRRTFWKFYMSTAVVFYGKILFGKHYPAFYLTESAKRFLKPGEFVEKLKQKGFTDIRVKKFLFGVIVLYQATKPAHA